MELARSVQANFVGPTGVRHSVDVAWETLFEAAATLRLLRADELADLIASGAILEIQVREPATTHTLTVAAGDGATAWRSALTKYRSENE